MMKKFISLKLIGLALLLSLMISCDQSDQEVAPPITDLGHYPLATFTNLSDATTFSEGDTLFVEVELSRWFERDIYFNVNVTDETGDESDISYPEEIKIKGYSGSVIIPIVIKADDVPEETETLSVSIGINAIEQRYIIHPDSQLPTYDLTINNYNVAGKLTVAFGWDTPDDDLDIFIFSPLAGLWGMAASSDNPEITKDLWQDDYYYFFDDYGVYLDNFVLAVDPYYVEGDVVNYTIALGEPDGTNTYFTGELRIADLDDDLYLVEPGNGGGYPVLNIDLDSEGDFTFTELDPHVVAK